MTGDRVTSDQYFTASLSTIRAIAATYEDEPAHARKCIAAYLVLCRAKQQKNPVLTTAGANSVSKFMGLPRPTCAEIIQDLKETIVNTEEAPSPAVMETSDWNREAPHDEALPLRLGPYQTLALPWHEDPVRLSPALLDGHPQTPHPTRAPLRKLLSMRVSDRERLDALLVLLELNANLRPDKCGGVDGRLLNRRWERGIPWEASPPPLYEAGGLYFTFHMRPNTGVQGKPDLHIADCLLERTVGSTDGAARKGFSEALRLLASEGLLHERIVVFDKAPEEHRRAQMQYVALFPSGKERKRMDNDGRTGAICHLACNALRRFSSDAEELLLGDPDCPTDGPFAAPSSQRPIVIGFHGREAIVRTIFNPDPEARSPDNAGLEPASVGLCFNPDPEARSPDNRLGFEWMRNLNSYWAETFEHAFRSGRPVEC